MQTFYTISESHGTVTKLPGPGADSSILFSCSSSMKPSEQCGQV